MGRGVEQIISEAPPRADTLKNVADPIEVLIVEDHLGIRKGLELLLLSEGLRIAGVASGLEEARALLKRRRRDVVLLDLHLGADSSIELVEEMRSREPEAAVVLYTGVTAPDSGLEAAANSGARGFVLKSSPVQRLLDALRLVASGGTYVDPGLAALLSPREQVTNLSTLSPRERQVLDLLAEGMTGQAIAESLFLSAETVRTHVRNATVKLGARTRVHAVALVVQSREAGGGRPPDWT